tara:strand:- start:1706 stop:4474 length:2769 start_codon:yes stop_codon:yes gene_type:complete
MNVLGNYSIVYNVSDDYGNDASAIRVVSVKDTTPPVITLNPTSITIEASLNTYVDISGADSFSDNYFSLEQLIIEYSNNVISNIPGTYQVICIAKDPCDNDISATRTVIVEDTTPPVITLSGDNPQTLTLDSSYVELEATAQDIVDGTIAFSSFDVCLNDLCMNVVGTYSVIYSVSDNAGYDISKTRTVNVVNDVIDWVLPVGTYPDSASLTAVVKINGTIINDGKLAAFIENSLRGVQDSLTDVPNIQAFPYGGNKTFALSVQGSAGENGDNGKLTTFKFSYNNNVYDLLQQYIYLTNEIVGSTTTPFILTNTPESIIKNPSLIDYEIPSYYQTESSGSIIFPQPSSYYRAYCVPTSFANVLNYYSDPSGKDLALQLNYTSQNSYPPLTDFLYNYQGRPLSATGVTDLNKIDLGYIFNTNAHGFDLSDGSYTGTKLVDFPKFVDFMNLVSSGAQYRYYNKGFGYNSDVSYAYSSVSGESVSTTSYSAGDISNVFSDIKSDISNGRPVILSFNHWNIVYNSAYSNGGSTIVNGLKTYFYDFSGQVSLTTDIQSTNLLYSNPEYIYEEWQVGEGLGHTVTCVGYIEDLSGKNWVIVQDNVNNSASADTDPNKTPTYVGVPLDASYLAMITTIDFSPQGTTPVTNLSCLAPEANVNIVDSGGNKYVFNNGSTYDDTLTYGLYNGTYVINNVPSGHPIAFLNKDVSNVLDYSGTVSEGSLQVDGVNYNFYSGTVTLTVTGDFGNISAYCKLHGYMGAQNKFTYTTVCNPVANISLSTNISVYNAGDVNNTLPQGYNSCLRLGDNSDICGNYIVNNQELVEQALNNIGVFVQNEEVYLQANSSIVEFSSVQTVIFKVYDEQLNLMKPLQDVNIILENSDYELLNQSNPDLNHFVVTANPPLVSADNDPTKYNLGPGLVKIGNLVRL